MQPWILLSCGRRTAKNGLSQRFLYENYAEAILAAGGIPFLFLGEEAPERLAERFDGLLLTGGEDIAPERYGEAPHPDCGEIDLRRDAAEWSLTAAFLAENKPIFGICRGLQFINAAMGGTLYQHLPTDCGVCHDDTVHPVTFAPDSRLGRLLGAETRCNSLHHQAIHRVAAGFRVTATAADGVIEAIEHESRPVWAVQFHPERMTGSPRFSPEGAEMAPIFSAFLSDCSR